jgi:hypothetical protein
MLFYLGKDNLIGHDFVSVPRALSSQHKKMALQKKAPKISMLIFILILANI